MCSCWGWGAERVLPGHQLFKPHLQRSNCRKKKFAPLTGSLLVPTGVPLHSLTYSIMESRYELIFFCFIVPLCTSDLSNHFVLEPYDFLFDTAVEAYYKGDWLSVILNMEKALRNKATVRNVKVQCRLSCANQTALGIPIPGTGSVEDLGFFQKILKRADCVNSCETEKLGTPTMHQVTEDVQLEFTKRSPYNYLQVAYFKVFIKFRVINSASWEL